MASPTLGPLSSRPGLNGSSTTRSIHTRRERYRFRTGSDGWRFPAHSLGRIPRLRLSMQFQAGARAGANFEKVMQGARNVPINTAEAGDVALRAKELADRGASMPKVVNSFLKNGHRSKCGTGHL